MVYHLYVLIDLMKNVIQITFFEIRTGDAVVIELWGSKLQGRILSAVYPSVSEKGGLLDLIVCTNYYICLASNSVRGLYFPTSSLFLMILTHLLKNYRSCVTCAIIQAIISYFLLCC